MNEQRREQWVKEKTAELMLALNPMWDTRAYDKFAPLIENTLRSFVALEMQKATDEAMHVMCQKNYDSVNAELRAWQAAFNTASPDTAKFRWEEMREDIQSYRLAWDTVREHLGNDCPMSVNDVVGRLADEREKVKRLIEAGAVLRSQAKHYPVPVATFKAETEWGEALDAYCVARGEKKFAFVSSIDVALAKDALDGPLHKERRDLLDRLLAERNAFKQVAYNRSPRGMWEVEEAAKQVMREKEGTS